MTDQLTIEELREQLTAHLDAVPVPPGDLDAVRRRSRTSKARRLAGPGLLAAAAVGIGALVLTQTSAPHTPDGSDGPDGDVVVADGPLDLSDGLRAFASPDDALYMAGRELPYDVEALDTQAVTTPHGIVYYDKEGLPTLLKPNGGRLRLAEGPSSPENGFGPTVKADAVQPHVAFALMDDGEATVTVYDLEDRSVVADHTIVCDESCKNLVIDGLDSGVVFLRGADGITVWDYENRQPRSPLAGPDTRLADVRNGVVLYDGVRPSVEMKGWRYVSGAIDAQLTFDGSHVLYWSDELTPTGVRATEPIKLDLPEPATFFTFDTDGSVLAATVENPSTVFDCVLPSGECEEVARMSTDHGDPLFIGSDG